MLNFKDIQMETIFTSSQNKNSLVRLKAITKIKYWNVLCRLAFCISIKDDALPRNVDEAADGVEMTWETFSGKYGPVYIGLLIRNLRKNNIEITKSNLNKFLRAHINRGIYLVFNHRNRSINQFLNIN
tara:strand:+ start:97 stop:480 length:384 start_codon:yes stop_codon:yes gene_type:complete